MFFQVLVGAIAIGSIYGLVALGYSIIYSASGLMSFVQGELLMLGSFLGLTFYKYLKLPFWVALLLTMVCMFLVGMIVEKYIIRKLQKSGANAIFIVMATIALSIILKNLAMLVWGSNVFQFPPIFAVSRLKFGKIRIQPESLMAIAIALFVMLVFHFFMTKSRLGDGDARRGSGPNGSFDGPHQCQHDDSLHVGDSLHAHGDRRHADRADLRRQRTHGNNDWDQGLRGRGDRRIREYVRSIVGSLMLGTIETFTAAYVSSMYKDFISFFILIIFLVFIPRGLFKGKVYGD